MPKIEKHPVATMLRECAMFDETQLQTLLEAYRRMLAKERWRTAEAIEKALYAFRREELEGFAYELEQHEAKRIAVSPSENADVG